MDRYAALKNEYNKFNRSQWSVVQELEEEIKKLKEENEELKRKIEYLENI